MIQRGEFIQYDYGEKKNYEMYGEKLPPEYNTSAILVPVKIFAGENDWLSTMVVRCHLCIICLLEMILYALHYEYFTDGVIKNREQLGN